MRKLTFLSVLIAVLSVVFFVLQHSLFLEKILSTLKDFTYYFGKDGDLLLIGITSSLNHYEKRQSLRNTWLTLVPKPKTKYYFLIGKHICPIPPQDRESVLDCQEKNYHLPKNTSDNTIFSTISQDSKTLPKYKGIGFHFGVSHGIIIQYLGIRRDVGLLTNKGAVRVGLYDTFRQERIVSATFILDGGQNADYIWKKIAPVYIPVGTEAEIRVEGIVDLELLCKYKQTWLDFGVINYLNIIGFNSAIKFSRDSCSLCGFNFTLRDSINLTTHIATKAERFDSWRTFIKQIQNNLQQEVSEKKDILLLDIVDVYRNLPLKMLHFYKWAAETQQFKYLLKTDDDTFINILRVESELKQNGDWDWWSCFRKKWPVQRAGKWKETVFKNKIYPTFPTGSGYILTWNVVILLYEEIQNLQTGYQGEDVALGIWVDSFKLKEHVGKECVWVCNEQCFSNSCNIGQISVQNMYLTMQNYNINSQSFGSCPNYKV